MFPKELFARGLHVAMGTCPLLVLIGKQRCQQPGAGEDRQGQDFRIPQTWDREEERERSLKKTEERKRRDAIPGEFAVQGGRAAM